MAFADGNIIIGTSVDVGGINTGLNKIEKSFKRLGKLATLALGVKALTGLGKAALEAASDLQEVQNVVDVSFTKTIGTVEQLGDSVKDLGYVIKQTADGTDVYVEDMTWKIESFAQTCIEKFGMSELAAKQTAGSFMAMGKSMGLSMEEASDMAVKLTGLTGDFASFYNISQDYARVALSAVYTGETETLKRYGIVLTEANLQQYALTQGITDNVKKMDARDKAILRYQYIMKATQDMEGDFVRTQGTWANQTRVLQQVWNQFLIELGNGLITVLTPLVQVLNQIVQALTRFITTLWQAIANIFHLDLQKVTDQANSTAGAVNDLTDGVEDLGDEVEKAGKKAKKQLANFDELNNLVTPSSKSSSSGGGGGLSLGDVDLGLEQLDPKDKDSVWSDIDNLYDLGKWIGDIICKSLESIDWNTVYQGARNFGKGLAEFLNGLISTDLFKDLGHTIAASLNTAIYASLSFAEEFDWKQFGTKIADGINEFFDTFDFASLANSIDAWVQGIFDAVIAFLKELDYSDIFKGIYEFFTSLDPETFAILIGFFALKKLIMTLMSEHLFKAIGEGILLGMGLNPGEQLFAPLFKSWGFTLGNKFALLKTNIGNGLRTALVGAFGTVATDLLGVGTIISGVVLALKEFFDMWEEGWSLGKTVLEGIGIALAAVGAVIMGAPALVASIVAGIVFAVSQLAIFIKEHWEEIKAVLKKAWDWVKNLASTIWNGITSFFTKALDVISSIVKKIGDVIRSVFEGIWNFIKGIINKIIGAFESFVNGIIKALNFMIRGLNHISFDVPDWVPGIGGETLGFNISEIELLSIPRLAKGAVIPPNNEFMAILGDQKSGTNIEAPLDTIKQALAETMQELGGTKDDGDIIIQIDGYEVFRAVRKQSNLFTKTTGIKAFN